MIAPTARPSVLPQAKAWGAVHTKPRCEKVVADFLGQRGVPHFLPLLPNPRSYGGRERTSLLPFFPGYLFYDAGSIPRREVFSSRRIVQVLEADRPEDLRSDLENLAAALAVHDRPRRAQFFVPGAPVEVISGPMRGLQGTLVRAGEHDLLVVHVRFLGFAAELTIDQADVRPL